MALPAGVCMTLSLRPTAPRSATLLRCLLCYRLCTLPTLLSECLRVLPTLTSSGTVPKFTGSVYAGTKVCTDSVCAGTKGSSGEAFAGSAAQGHQERGGAGGHE
eukprot:2168656-Rhodomonas_salina.3